MCNSQGWSSILEVSCHVGSFLALLETSRERPEDTLNTPALTKLPAEHSPMSEPSQSYMKQDHQLSPAQIPDPQTPEQIKWLLF